MSNDGVDDGQHDARHGGPDDNPQLQERSATATNREVKVKEKVQERPQAQRRTSSQPVEDDIHGEITAVRVTRSGHLFATLTRTTLTIWQTKACVVVRGGGPFADTLRSLPLY